jgi:thiamine-monophosphate kinase
MSADEFSIIQTLLAPLASTMAARGLRDDAALVEFAGPVVVTTDALVEGVHFLPSDPIHTVAQKALRVNLSDLAAKAARPLGYLLTLFWPRARPAAQIAEFAQGLAQDQAIFGCALLGGDTVSTPGPLSISITMFGALVGVRAPDRREAKAGQDVWVSGVIGDGWLGLQAALRGDASHPALARYRLPQPRMELAACLAARAGAAMDVSDGLLADSAKLASASGLAIEIDLPSLPHSPAGLAYIAAADDPISARLQLATGGDDFEILFSADPAQRGALAQQSLDLGLALTRIGSLRTGSGLLAFDAQGQSVALGTLGFSHALGC